jgi:leucyl-tRNA synthetase
MNQGQVIYGGASMSKSKGNIVEPMPLVERWGADSMRLTILFAGPFEDDIDWALIEAPPDRRPGVHQWLGRVFAAVGDAVETDAAEPEALVRLTHRTVRAVTDDMERFRFNVAISKMMVLTKEMRSAPLAPFAAEELWREALGHEASVHVSEWPTYDEALAAEETVTMVVQVDGKVRDKIQVDAGISEAQALELARASEGAARAIAGRAVAKEIVRAPRLVNLVTAR